MKAARLVAVSALAVIGTACSGSSGSSTNPTTLTVRGTQVSAYSCTAAASATPVTVSPSTVTELKLCPVDVPNQPSKAAIVTPDDKSFTRLVSALALPDKPPTNDACAAYADVPQKVLAKTEDAPLLLHIPVDGCGHYRTEATSALAAARAAQSPDEPTPDLVGLSVAQARTKLAAHDLRLGAVTHSNDNQATGVVSQNPPGGILLAPGQRVDVVLGSGG
ncbi:MAG TPA: PASTA domain-containing protein [Mycobacteriales bacterium]|nr:PASTA domain-containing protein [Mycobacteriales bacterium]